MSPRVGLDVNILLEHAAELANKHGLDNVTMAMLAQKLGIRSPSVYNHVNGLNDLRSKLALFGLKQLTDLMIRAAAGRTKAEAIYAISDAYLTFARKQPGLYEASLRAPSQDDEVYKKVASELVELVVRVMNSFGLEDENALHAVRGLRSLLHGFASLE